MEGGEECECSVFRAKHRRERVSAKPIERHQEVAEAMFRGAELRAAPPPEGAGEPAVDTCCLSAAALSVQIVCLLSGSSTWSISRMKCSTSVEQGETPPRRPPAPVSPAIHLRRTAPVEA